ncbi:MAG TPA: histidine kinase [Prolixibacteraceae bacterium]|nr:histidine kinase [Prolixibacteraceae bacterium]
MQNKDLQFVSNLSSYKWKYILFRVGTVSLFAMLFMLFADVIAAKEELIVPIPQYIRVIILFNIITESNVLLDNLSERYFAIPQQIKTRVLLHFLISIGIGVLALLYFKELIKEVNVLQQPITWLMVAFGFIFVFILIIVSISLRITSKWMSAQEEVKDLKQLQLRNDYNALQDQLNPHFLFNNLSVLKSMIKYAPDAAVDFTQNFTDTYRYVLQNAEKETVSLKEELEFLNAYIALHKERVGDGLSVKININNNLIYRKIPPLSLQLLIENAIKHNIATTDEPLNINIKTNQEHIEVENNIRPKENSYSTSKGLKNLTSRYKFLTDREVVIKQNKKTFKVELPLL